MLALRYAAVLALAVWVGGLLVLGAFVAPAVFDVLSARGSDGRALAGAVFGASLDRFHAGAYVCAAVLFVSLLTRGVLGPRPRRFAARVILTAVMSAVTAYVGLVLSPRIAAAQQALGTSVASLPETDPRRIEFGRMHGLSTSLLLVPVLGGMVLLFFELKD